jgi:short-subunit dehydrogenase
VKLQGCRALLTGASGGIGSALASALAQAGAQLALTGRRADALAETAAGLQPLGGCAHVLPADLEQADALPGLVDRAVHALGGIDLLVHNAGLAEAAAADAPDPTTVERQIAVNLLAPMALTRLALPHLLRAGGTVVHILSGAALVPVPRLAAYSAAKAGLAAWGDALHREFAARGLHVLNVYAGPTDTPMLRRSPLAMAMTTPEPPEVLAAAVVQALREDRRSIVRGGPQREAQLRAAREDPTVGDALHAQPSRALRH